MEMFIYFIQKSLYRLLQVHAPTIMKVQAEVHDLRQQLEAQRLATVRDGDGQVDGDGGTKMALVMLLVARVILLLIKTRMLTLLTIDTISIVIPSPFLSV